MKPTIILIEIVKRSVTVKLLRYQFLINFNGIFFSLIFHLFFLLLLQVFLLFFLPLPRLFFFHVTKAALMKYGFIDIVCSQFTMISI